jgi:hypothetical protein
MEQLNVEQYRSRNAELNNLRHASEQDYRQAALRSEASGDSSFVENAIRERDEVKQSIANLEAAWELSQHEIAAEDAEQASVDHIETANAANEAVQAASAAAVRAEGYLNAFVDEWKKLQKARHLVLSLANSLADGPVNESVGNSAEQAFVLGTLYRAGLNQLDDLDGIQAVRYVNNGLTLVEASRIHQAERVIAAALAAPELKQAA